MAENEPFSPAIAKNLKKLWSQGFTFQCHQPQRFSDPLWELMADMEKRFGCLVGANVYLTPAGCQGLNPHWDDVDVWVLQTVGSKTWRIYPDATNTVGGDSLKWRPRTHSPDLDRSGLGAPVTYTLQPGDVLYLPRGTPHEAVATSGKDGCGAGGSVHITLSSFQCWDASDLAVHTLRWLSDGAEGYGGPAASQAAAACARAMRAPLPLRAVFSGDGASNLSSSADLAKTVAAALRAAADALDACPSAVNGAVDQLARDFMESRLPPPPADAVEDASEERNVPHGPDLSDFIAPPPGLQGYARVSVTSDRGRECSLVTCAGNDRRTHMMSVEALAGALSDEEEDDDEREDGGSDDDADEDEGGVMGDGVDNDEQESDADEGSDEDGEDEGSDAPLSFPAACAPALRAILTAPPTVGMRVRDLPVSSDAMRVELARALRAAGVVRTIEPAHAPRKGSAKASSGSSSSSSAKDTKASKKGGAGAAAAVEMVSLADILGAAAASQAASAAEPTGKKGKQGKAPLDASVAGKGRANSGGSSKSASSSAHAQRDGAGAATSAAAPRAVHVPPSAPSAARDDVEMVSVADILRQQAQAQAGQKRKR